MPGWVTELLLPLLGVAAAVGGAKAMLGRLQGQVDAFGATVERCIRHDVKIEELTKDLNAAHERIRELSRR